MLDKYFEIASKQGIIIRTTKTYWHKILAKHPSVAGLETEVKNTLQNPIEIRVSQKDDSVYLHYRKLREYYLCVVTRQTIGDNEGYIITVYITDKIKIGSVIWKK
ncbi:MAG: DUF4258 domain-containing protein [Planctomycetes bacterium]|nr:DUF4258 domain-containing protein [Planctomycetota bacterium]